MALYAYGLMRADDGRAAVHARPADAEPVLDAIDHEGLCALVSDVPRETVRLRREALTGHVDVLQEAFAQGPVLPLRFGTVIGDRESVIERLLSPQAASLLLRLDALEDTAEMQVRATYHEEPLLRSIVEQSPALRRAAERMRAMPAAATHFDRIRIGESITAAVQQRSAHDAGQMLEALTPLAVAVCVSDPQHERMALSAAFLVERPRVGPFDAEVERLSDALAGQMQLTLTGPMPAYSFADREWGASGARKAGQVEEEGIASWA